MPHRDTPQLIERLAERYTDWTVHRTLGERITRDGAALRLVLEAIGTHPNPKVRRLCADLLDHHGDDRCVPTLLAALRDPVPRVRRQAVRSLNCQRCKRCALSLDTVPYLVDVALSDDSLWVRREAVCALSLFAPDERAATALRILCVREADRKITGLIHGALRHHDPDYRRRSDEAARARHQDGVFNGRTASNPGH